jgi:hypothetical protein
VVEAEIKPLKTEEGAALLNLYFTPSFSPSRTAVPTRLVDPTACLCRPRVPDKLRCMKPETSFVAARFPLGRH